MMRTEQMESRILVVDDDDAVRNMVAVSLERFGYSIDMADSVNRVMELMESVEYDIIIMDKNMPDTYGNKEGGMHLLRCAKMHLPATQVIMITGYATIETAIEAMKLGAFDYITKPFSSKELKEKIDRILEYKSFINPDNTIQMYKALHDEILNLFKNRNSHTDDELHELLRSINTKIDHFFRAQKEWERIILTQREALGNIAVLAEQLKEDISQTEPSFNLFEKICEESNRRI